MWCLNGYIMFLVLELGMGAGASKHFDTLFLTRSLASNARIQIG